MKESKTVKKNRWNQEILKTAVDLKVVSERCIYFSRKNKEDEPRDYLFKEEGKSVWHLCNANYEKIVDTYARTQEIFEFEFFEGKESPTLEEVFDTLMKRAGGFKPEPVDKRPRGIFGELIEAGM